jgi:hypothetical protein
MVAVLSDNWHAAGMALRTRPLGASGRQLTTVGFGAWAIGGLGWEHAWGPR